MTPAEPRLQYLHAVLEYLHQTIPQMSGSLVANAKGDLVTSLLRETSTGEQLAPMSATGIALGQRLTEILNIAPLQEIKIQSRDAQVFVHHIQRKGALILIIPPDVNVGIVNLEGRAAAQTIAHLL